MDSITQVTLGAAVGEFVLGKKVGNKAILWGAVAGTVPDLDVIANPFLDAVQKLTFHRGFSHSFLFAFIFSPFLGYVIGRIYRKNDGVDWRDWAWLSFWCIFTHPLLDSLTTYGTQLFWPFSSYAVDFSTVFVVDPFYTVPLLGFVLAAMFLKRTSRVRRLLNTAGLVVSSGYLILTIFNKFHMESVFAEALGKQGVRYERLMTNPTPFNNFLWRGMAEERDGYWIGFYSVFDDDRSVRFSFLPRNEQLIREIKDERAISQLIKTSDGYYNIIEKKDGLYFNDLRFIEINSWTKDLPREQVFFYKIIMPEPGTGQPVEIRRESPSISEGGRTFDVLVDRVFGAP